MEEDLQRSNIRIYSNVFLLPTSILDEPFRFQVRGRVAIRALLVRKFGGFHDADIANWARGWVNDWQLKEMRTDLRCVHCRRIPEGVDFVGNISFRCWDRRCNPAGSIHSGAQSVRTR